MTDYVTFNMNPKMEYRRLGPSGLRVSALSLGGYLTLGGTVKGSTVTEIIKCAFENGINFLDTAESYAHGESEVEIGRALKELKIRRSDMVISTKVFFGVREGPNATGLSRKHIIEGLNESLERLQMDYVDVYFAHRCDPTVPMEEIVRAFNYCINTGKAHYWATSEWTAAEIEEAWHIADKYGLVGPIAEQAHHNLLVRERAEVEYKPIYEKYGTKLTVFGALAGGMLAGRYNNGIPADSRFSLNPQEDWIQERLTFLKTPEGAAQIEQVKALTALANEALGASSAQLALAMILAKPSTGTIILGASTVKQLEETLQVLDIVDKLTPEIQEKVEAIFNNKPKGQTVWRK